MFRFTNLSGTIMWKDEQLVNFAIRYGEVIDCDIIAYHSCHLPFEFRVKAPKERAVLLFLEDRVTPSTRIDLQRDLRLSGLDYYDPTTILRYNKGWNVSDYYWVRTDDDPYITFDGVRELARKHHNEYNRRMPSGHWRNY